VKSENIVKGKHPAPAHHGADAIMAGNFLDHLLAHGKDVMGEVGGAQEAGEHVHFRPR
jgi:hypothetical protein